MNKKNIITFIIASVFACIPCYAQKPSMKGITHGKEKAYNGEEKPGEIKELHYTLIQDDVEQTDIELKYVSHFYEATYTKDGERHVKTIDPREIQMLQDILEHIYKAEDYYQDYKAKKGPKGLEWHLGTKHQNAVFLINAERVEPEKIGIVNAITGYFNAAFELTTSDKPFPEGKITLLTYSNRGSMLPGGPQWRVEATNDGGYEVTFTDDRAKFNGGQVVEKKIKCPAKVGDDLLEILKAGKVQNYKSQYMNPGVTDGNSWSFSVKFSGGKTVSSQGYMDGPRDSSGINNTLKYLDNLIK